ncbi:MAG: hypothetical protein IPM37_13245 [Hahellaceae bacterium]|nr:hypothetical protein [Hahellaceae bacterium]
MLFNRLVPSLLLATLLSACSNSEDTTGDGARIGYLFPAEMSGISYETESKSGLTGRRSEFVYKEGETITFSVGGVVLADRVPAKQYMTTVDFETDLIEIIDAGEVDKLLHLHENLEKTALNNFRVTNKYNFLRALDDDYNSDNGIRISASTREALANDPSASQIDFTLNPDDFIDEDSVPSQIISSICFPKDVSCDESVGGGRVVYSGAQALTGLMGDRYYDIASLIFLSPEIFQINASDTRLYTIQIQTLGLYEKISELEVVTADELAQLGDNPPATQKDVVGIDSFSALDGTVSFYSTGEPGDETEIIINVKLENDYRWFKKVFRVKLL